MKRIFCMAIAVSSALYSGEETAAKEDNKETAAIEKKELVETEKSQSPAPGNRKWIKKSRPGGTPKARKAMPSRRHCLSANGDVISENEEEELFFMDEELGLFSEGDPS